MDRFEYIYNKSNSCTISYSMLTLALWSELSMWSGDYCKCLFRSRYLAGSICIGAIYFGGYDEVFILHGHILFESV